MTSIRTLSAYVSMPFRYKTYNITMPKLTPDDIRKRFELSNDFNEIFEAFEQAIEQHIDDIELYRLLFWNHSLSSDELCLFGEKLSKEFPHLAYDVYMWLANIFEVTYSMVDNYELALTYYKKAAAAKPSETDPYLDAADCYEPDLNIPSVHTLIDFLKDGIPHVANPKLLYRRLAELYEYTGNDEMIAYYRRKAEEETDPSSPSPTNE